MSGRLPPSTSAAGASDVAQVITRIERTSVLVVLVGTVVLGLAAGWRVGGGVLGGGLMSAIAYWILARGVAAMGPPAPGAEPTLANRRTKGSLVRVALGLAGRYALLLAAGYVIIARLHLHPVGVLVGVSAVVVAAMVEAVRSWR